MTPAHSRRRAKLDLRTEYRGRELTGAEAERIRVDAGFGVKASALLERLERDADRPVEAPDAEWMDRAMRAVEDRIVEALWTLKQQPCERGPGWPNRHGPDYLQEYREAYAIAVDNKGRWEQPRVRPPKPSSKAIDAMDEPLNWISGSDKLLPPDRCALLWTAASTKRGDVARGVAWALVKAQMPELADTSVSTLRRRYQDGLRQIVAELVRRER